MNHQVPRELLDTLCSKFGAEGVCMWKTSECDGVVAFPDTTSMQTINAAQDAIADAGYTSSLRIIGGRFILRLQWNSYLAERVGAVVGVTA